MEIMIMTHGTINNKSEKMSGGRVQDRASFSLRLAPEQKL